MNFFSNRKIYMNVGTVMIYLAIVKNAFKRLINQLVFSAKKGAFI